MKCAFIKSRFLVILASDNAPMIVSHKYKFVFIEYPQTGCSAVATELIANYGGERILFKHAQYHEFLKQASSEEKKYFAFSTIRNPMDIVVSKYFKYKNNHKNYIDKPIVHGKVRKLVMPGYERARRDYILKNNASFEQFFLKYFNQPYSGWSILAHKNLDFLIRFENLSEDFEQVIAKMGIELVRPLPLFNKTEGKSKPFFEYYESESAKERAFKVFGPYMCDWGYEFPQSWNFTACSAPRGWYAFVNVFRKIYWRFLR